MRPYNRRKEQKILRDIRDRFNNNPPKPKEKYEGRDVYETDKNGNTYIFTVYEGRERYE